MADSLMPMLIGEAPSPRGDRFHSFPLSGPPARVLCQLAGIPPVEGGTTYGRWTWALYDRFECENLFRRYRDATPWSVPAARSRAERLLPDIAGRVVVCLGRRPLTAVWQALAERHDLGPLEPSFHAWCTGEFPDQPAALSAIPHPSGRNRALNDPEERVRSGETLRRALETADPSATNSSGRAEDATPFATIVAPFEECANCGSTASENVTWNRTGGWTCAACGQSDYPEAAS